MPNVKLLPDGKATFLLLIPLGMYLLLSGLYMLAVPVGEAPDEPGHMRCIEQVAIENRLPQMTSTTDESIDWWLRENLFSDYMCYHMPAYYLLSGQVVRLMSTVTDAPLHFEYPPIRDDYPGEGALFVHQPNGRFGQLDQPLTLISLRIISILLGLTVLWSAFVVARRLFPEQLFIAVLAVTLIAGWPQFLFISRGITNDVLATAVAALILAILTNTGNPKRFFWLALLSSLALLTKLTVAFTVGIVLLIWLLEWIVYADKRRKYGQMLLIIGGVWLATGSLMRLDPTIWAHLQFSFSDFTGGASGSNSPAYWQQVYLWTIHSGWAWFGWLSVAAPLAHAMIWWFSLEITAILGIYGILKRPLSPQTKLLLLTLAAWVAAILISYIQVTANRWQPQFRFALAILPVLTTFAAGGMLNWFRQRPRLQTGIVLAFAVLLTGYNLWVITAVILPAYT